MDINVLEELSRNVQLPIDQLAGVYLSELTGLRQTLNDSITAGDTEVAHRAAHSIKGAALSIGAAELATIARELESSSLDSMQLNALDSAYKEMQQQIEQYLGHQPAIG